MTIAQLEDEKEILLARMLVEERIKAVEKGVLKVEALSYSPLKAEEKDEWYEWKSRYRREDEEKQRQLKEALKDLLERRGCLLYTSPSPRDGLLSRMPSSA